ncbi:hypothetical protein IFM46972_02717, partial [Aspergillus udagawae]
RLAAHLSLRHLYRRVIFLWFQTNPSILPPLRAVQTAFDLICKGKLSTIVLRSSNWKAFIVIRVRPSISPWRPLRRDRDFIIFRGINQSVSTTILLKATMDELSCLHQSLA